MSNMVLLGESKFDGRSLAVGPLAAVAAATRANDYLELYRHPSQIVQVKSVKFFANATQAAAATNYVTFAAVAILGTTVRTLNSLTLTTNTGGGLTAQAEVELVKAIDNAKLQPGERLALRIANTGTGVATAGFSVHVDVEVSP
jgi:hypothetical protein